MQEAAETRSSKMPPVAVWALTGFGLYIVGWIASILAIVTVERFVLDPLGVRPEAGEVSLSIRNGMQQVAWGCMVAATAIPIGRKLVPGLRFGGAGALVLVVGLLLAAIAELLIVEFDRHRSGLFGVRHVGLAIAAPPAIVGVALATWAAMAVPRSDRRPLVALAAAAGVGFGLAMLPSVSGLSDGIRADSVPLAASLLAGAAYVALAPFIARR